MSDFMSFSLLLANGQQINLSPLSSLAKFGKLACEACGFDFQTRYGNAGAGLIDVHHVRQLHTLQLDQKTHLDDLACCVRTATESSTLHAIG
ncbi:hypothetical protein [Pseudomonas sp.]|uniref:hypothetical protein n=1 Tax=Pseudomonas sp. TaxID=306 RepID=UPI002B540778|nr:hypothetical protein [Pseudomonas sp.]HUE94064.1 hypothetical protein [Pseudomonas sp.]